ncbi:MAG TPA: DUF4097 family beta strand repeat-containing protein [Pyrinomonadaceae bacterium]|nr:DUF4097 family beta strand repeat-containing protein [Pyrinomonadaceae bacterium]
MRNRNLLITFAITLASLAAAACAADASSSLPTPDAQTDGDARRVERQFNVASGKRLDVDLETGGALDISGWDQESVSVRATLGGRDGAQSVVDFRETGAGLAIHSRYEGGRRNYSTNIRFEIKVPRRFDVQFNTMGGRIRLADLEGSFGGETMGGALDLSNLKGRLDLSTMGGNITLRGSEVDGKVSTMGGEVLVEDVTGDVKGSSMGGKVIYKNVTNRSGVSTGSEVRITSMGGDIRVEDAPAGANVSTMGGDITIRSAVKFVRAKTMGGDIRIEAVDGAAHATTMGGDVTVRMVGNPEDGDRAVELTSMGGEIELTVPDGLSMDIYIEIARTKNNFGRDAQIVSDFPLQQRESADWEYRHGTPRKYLYGTGQTGGGRNKIVIKTINGDVRLKRG